MSYIRLSWFEKVNIWFLNKEPGFVIYISNTICLNVLAVIILDSLHKSKFTVYGYLFD